jgi:hypothetical protein
MKIQMYHIQAEPGKIFARKSDNEPLGTDLWLGIEDRAENYIEIDPPAEEAEEGLKG